MLVQRAEPGYRCTEGSVEWFGAPSPVQPGHGHCQGWGSHGSSGQPVQYLTTKNCVFRREREVVLELHGEQNSRILEFWRAENQMEQAEPQLFLSHPPGLAEAGHRQACPKGQKSPWPVNRGI